MIQRSCNSCSLHPFAADLRMHGQGAVSELLLAVDSTSPTFGDSGCVANWHTRSTPI